MIQYTCDKCGCELDNGPGPDRSTGVHENYVAARHIVNFKTSGIEIDLCKPCNAAVRLFATRKDTDK